MAWKGKTFYLLFYLSRLAHNLTIEISISLDLKGEIFIYFGFLDTKLCFPNKLVLREIEFDVHILLINDSPVYIRLDIRRI